MATLQVIHPGNGKLLREVEEIERDEAFARLAAAREAFLKWRTTSFAERRSLMQRVAAILRDERDEFAQLMTGEMGKPIAAAESEAEKCAWVCEYFAENAEDFLAEEPIASDAGESVVRFEPLGPVLAIMPWNFPFWQLFRFAAPGLMAGNVGLLKHAPNVPGCAQAITDIFLRAGFPPGVFTNLQASNETVAEVIARPELAAVTLTGSVRAGRAVASEAGGAIKKTVLELGGSDPFVVLADADLDTAVANAVLARTINSGQSCIAAKRFIVVGAIGEPFVAEMTRRVAALKVGDPFDRDNDVGPLARRDLVDNLHRQVEESVAAGARILTGGQPLERPGFYYAPTVLDRVAPGMAAFEEETFGPVAAIVRASSTDEAVELANRTSYGLGASIWTSDAKAGREIAERVEAGAVFVNGIVKSDPRLPFGGIKESGYGRELSAFGIREFVNVKTVWIASD